MRQTATTPTKKAKYPGWRHMTASERYNARMNAIWERARALGAFDPHPPIVQAPSLQDGAIEAAHA